MQDARYKMQDAGCKMQDARYKMQDAGIISPFFINDYKLTGCAIKSKNN